MGRTALRAEYVPFDSVGVGDHILAEWTIGCVKYTAEATIVAIEWYNRGRGLMAENDSVICHSRNSPKIVMLKRYVPDTSQELDIK